MGWFDEYIPDPPVGCPRCGNILGGRRGDWTGSYGRPCGLVWHQGYAAPVAHHVDDDIQLSPAELENQRLPEEFHIRCVTPCACGFYPIGTLRCTTLDGVWTTTEFYPLPPAATDVGDNILLCPVCTRDAWHSTPGRRHYLCSTCNTILRAPTTNDR